MRIYFYDRKELEAIIAKTDLDICDFHTQYYQYQFVTTALRHAGLSVISGCILGNNTFSFVIGQAGKAKLYRCELYAAKRATELGAFGVYITVGCDPNLFCLSSMVEYMDKKIAQYSCVIPVDVLNRINSSGVFGHSLIDDSRLEEYVNLDFDMGQLVYYVEGVDAAHVFDAFGNGFYDVSHDNKCVAYFVRG